MKSDEELQRDVLAGFDWDPSVGTDGIGVDARDGLVTLTGQVRNYAQKWRAAAAAQRVDGVMGVALKLAVTLGDDDKRCDGDVAAAARQVLAWTCSVPAGAVRVDVADGWVTLSGKVEWAYQRHDAEAAVRNLIGVAGLVDLIQVMPAAEPCDVTTRIEQALHRLAHNHANAIAVTVNGGTVTLSGRLDSWTERKAIRRAAWRAPGIRSVVDQTTIAA
jgi:osmotically-inducible protein OsmY